MISKIREEREFKRTYIIDCLTYSGSTWALITLNNYNTLSAIMELIPEETSQEDTLNIVINEMIEVLGVDNLYNEITNLTK